MESDSLKTASLYINNQLLSRGLLRNGQNIDFARPDRGDGGVEGTMGRVISVVNDLILRRDRDALQRENLSQTIRSLRADALRQTSDTERLQTKHADAQRKCGIAEATERAMKTQLRSAEQAARGLREEMARMKILVGQTRAQCANEVRKRERTIEGMKKHVSGRARGSGKAVGVVSITVVPGLGAEVVGGSAGGAGGGAASTSEPGYDLRMETNEFLTELARGLSEENEHMAALLRRTVETLRSLSGCEREGMDGGMVVQMENGYEGLAAEMEMVIEHLRTLLTNPSFVPLEEVEVREEEIIRLREGWEKMESRWREAMQMMEGWRKRMARSGQTVNLEELKMGLRLSPLKPKEEGERALQMSTLQEEADGDTQADIDAMDRSDLSPPEPDFLDEDSESSMFEEDPVDEAPEDVSEQREDFSLDSVSSLPGSPPQLSPLKETHGNRGGFTTIVEENTWDLLQLHTSSPQKQNKKSTPQPSQKENISHASPSEDEVDLLKTSAPTSSRKNPSPTKKTSRRTPDLKPTTMTTLPPPKLKDNPSSRLPRPSDPNTMPPQQSPLTMATIAAKLAATEREADVARVRAKIKAARMKSSSAVGSAVPVVESAVPVSSTSNSSEAVKDDMKDGEDKEKEAGAAKTRKRKAPTRQGGRASRRRSTLSPWELESLILGGKGE